MTDKLRAALRSIHDQVSPTEASAIVDVARLAAGADGTTHPDELAAIRTLSQIVYEMASITDVPAPTPAIDAGRLLDIGETLERIGARELAFASAVAVAIHGELTADEQTFITRLADALVVEPPRAEALTRTIAAAVQP